VSERLMRVMHGTSAQAITRLLAVLFPDAGTALDTTFGNGRFWDGTAHVSVTGLDIDPARAKHVACDFTALPFADGSFDVVIFDPPFLTDEGKRVGSIMGARFKTYPTLAELQPAVEHGTREAFRVAKLGIIVKCQTYMHASKLVRMPRWIEDALAPGVELFDELHLVSRSKVTDRKWTRSQLSVWSNHSTFLVFRRDGAVHKRRRPSAAMQEIAS
jgi:hypothetical protein